MIDNQEKLLLKAVDTLEKGQVMLFNPDSVWGLSCDYQNKQAIKKIEAIKGRKNQKPFILLCANFQEIKKVVVAPSPLAFWLMEHIKVPLTIIFPNAQNVPEHCLGPQGSVAIRIPQLKASIQLLERFGKPIVSTSANLSSSPTPRTFEDIPQSIKTEVDFIVNLHQPEQLLFKKPSTLIKIINKDKFQILRA